jgi:phosphatidylserine/phosphatidylglycerophosphate/cardiolipin synthase-like enzyme
MVGFVQARPALELVESFPVETDFDQADIRDTQEVWLELINEAESETLWHTFYLAHEEGKATQPVVDALKAAARRGVQVHLLVDPKFVEVYPDTLRELHALENIEVRNSPVGRWLGGVMHAKMILVDGKTGFLGSQNFDWRSLEHIRELGIVFRDAPLVKVYSDVFRWEWNHHDHSAIPEELPDLMPAIFQVGGSRVIPTISPVILNKVSSMDDEYQILQLLGKAEKSIDIALLSYAPTDHSGKNYYAELDNSIRSAALRGVKVRLLVSHWSEEKESVDDLLSLDVLDNVEVRACRVALAKEGEIPFARVHHSKYLVVDAEQGWLGTSNWSRGYFHDSRNYGLIFLSGPIPERLDRLYEFDWAHASALKDRREKRI